MAQQEHALSAVKVLHVLKIVHPEGAGVQSYLASVAAALDGSPIKFAFGGLAPGKAPAFPGDFRHMGTTGASRLSNIWRFWRWLRRDVPQMDLVHIHDVFGVTLVLAALACWLAGVPYVVSPHGQLVAEARRTMDWRFRLFLRVLALSILRKAALLVVTTELDRADLADLDPALRVAVVHPGLASCPPADPVSPDHGTLRIGFVGRLAPVKDVPTLLRAVAVLRSRGRDASVDIIGWASDKTEGELHALVNELGIEGAVHFHGKLHGKQRDEIVRMTHVVAVPSLRENFSFATAESLVLGIPVVVSSRVGLASIVKKHGCGSVVPPGDITGWANALQEFADPAVRMHAASQARICAAKEFSLATMRIELEEVYREVLDGTGPRQGHENG